MACGCNKKLGIRNNSLDKNMQFDNNNNIQLDNSKIFDIDLMASMSIDDIVNMYRKGYRLEEKSIENNDYINSPKFATASKADFTNGRETEAVQTSSTNTWDLYYTTSVCDTESSLLSYRLNGGSPVGDYYVVVPCGEDHDVYIIETFINHLIQYQGLSDTDIINVHSATFNSSPYTKRWTCATTTGICSQIDGPGYASKAKCTGIWPCNPNLWEINTSTLTGTVTVSGIYLAWSLTPKNGTTVNFNFGNSVNYDGIGMTPVIYTDSTGITQIGVYYKDSWGIGKSYAMNTSYHGGDADFYLMDSDINIISKTPGYAWKIQYPKSAGDSGSGMLIGLVGIVAIGMMTTAKKPSLSSGGLVGVGKAPIE